MLQPVASFPFMELPPEIRNNIYSHLLAEDQPVKMWTTKVTRKPRRPVRRGFRDRISHSGFKWDVDTHKWSNQLPSAHSILRVNKQIFRETVTIAYGDNRFDFHDLADLKVFLDHIDGMRPYVRHIHIESAWAFPHNNSRAALRLLKDATALHTLSFLHINVCQDSSQRWQNVTSPQKLVSDCAMALRALYRAHKGSKSEIDVRNIIKVVFERCRECNRTAPDYANNCVYDDNDYRCGTACKDGDRHCQEVEAKIYNLITQELKIKD